MFFFVLAVITTGITMVEARVVMEDTTAIETMEAEATAAIKGKTCRYSQNVCVTQKTDTVTRYCSSFVEI